MLAVIEVSPLGSIHIDLTTASALHYSLHYTSRQSNLCSLQLQDISSIAQFQLIQPHVFQLVISTPSDQLLNPSPELPVLQNLLNLILLTVINHNWWAIGLHPIILIGLEESHVENIVDTSQCLPVPSSS